MKKLLLIFAVVFFTAGFATKVSAQVTKSNTAGGEILAPITLTVNNPMEFGKLAVLAGGGTVTLTPDAATTLTPSVGVSVVTGVTPTAASYTVGGTAGYGYSVIKPISILTTRASGTETMTISAITVRTTVGLGTVGTLVGGSDNFYLGGTLTIGGGQVPGVYTGTFNVTVNYN